jgi:hypothetical protein
VQGVGLAYVCCLLKTVYIVCLINEKVGENVVHVFLPGVFLGKACSLFNEVCVCSCVFDRDNRESLEVAGG